MPIVNTSAADRRKFKNSERVNSVIVLNTENSQKRQSIPFVFALMSNLHGNATSEEHKKRREQVIEGKLKKANNTKESIFDLHEVCQLSDFAELFQKFKPEFHKAVANMITPGGPDMMVEYTFKNMGSFDPKTVAANIPAIRALQELLEAIERVRSMSSSGGKKAEMLQKIFDDKDLQQAISKG